ncbi:flagellar hook-length control protein FliK [Falsibacillus pallidus]|uniref:Flagellar hook-length control protein FliK n=1 Tax=Falsibacillus pallidus TaxID=493781 RepID=A0A370GUT4_9BACI|nr:flagellar hook-length control protein FliK [Falsibacillus pallidus]RDI47455.1 flagellar hook-length control protein FliK [Falsibacillus pallidus]
MNVAGTMPSSAAGKSSPSVNRKSEIPSGNFKNLLGAVYQSTLGKDASATKSEDYNKDAMDTMDALKELLEILNQSTTLPLNVSNDLSHASVQENEGITLQGIAKILGITKDKLINVLKSISDKLKELTPGNSTPVDKGKKQDPMDMLMNLISQLSQLSKEAFKQLPKDDIVMILKAGKSLEAQLMATDLDSQGIKKAINLKDSLKQIKDTINGLQSDMPKLKQKEIITTAFSRVLAVSQTKGEKPQSTQSSISEGTHTETAEANPVQLNMTIQEQFAIFTNKDAKAPNFESFVKQFSDILAKSQVSPLPNGNKLLIKLYPEQLGSLRIELLQKDGVITAKLLASTNAAKDLLEGSLSSLKNAFSQQHIQVDKIDIYTNSTEQQKFDKQQNPQQHQQHRREDQSGTDQQKPESGLEFAEELQELLFNTNI